MSSKKNPEPTQWWCHPQAASNPKLPNLKKIDTARLPASLEGLNCSLAQLFGKLWWCKPTQTLKKNGACET